MLAIFLPLVILFCSLKVVTGMMKPGQDEQGDVSRGLTLMQHASTNLLAMASLVVENAEGQKLVVKALVDPCSQASFVASRFYQFLKLPSQKCGLLVEGINDTKLAK